MNDSADRRILFDFKDRDQALNWRSINDVVMGGRSRGKALWNESGFLQFEGMVSFENGGGFASITSPAMEMSGEGWDFIEIHVMGDGRVFKLTLRTDSAMDGISYQHRFRTTPGQWNVHSLAVRDFVPTYHGRVLEEVAPLEAKRISRLGFIIADRQEGAFALSIRHIALTRKDPGA